MTAPTSFDVSALPKTGLKPARSPLTGGLSLIGLGAVLLAASRLFWSENWWAIFIFVPALALLAGAARLWQHSGGHFNLWVRLALFCGLPTLTTALIFMLPMSWSLGWTVMLMVMGGAVMLNGFARPGLPIGSFLRGLTDLLFWIGVSMLALGFTFWLDRLGVINLQTAFGSARWWSAFILLPGLGALLNAAVYKIKGHPAAAASQLGLGLWIVGYAAGHLAGVDELWFVPAMLIAAGVAVMLPALAPR